VLESTHSFHPQPFHPEVELNFPSPLRVRDSCKVMDRPFYRLSVRFILEDIAQNPMLNLSNLEGEM
jgi:hypothetical protein